MDVDVLGYSPAYSAFTIQMTQQEMTTKLATALTKADRLATPKQQGIFQIRLEPETPIFCMKDHAGRKAVVFDKAEDKTGEFASCILYKLVGKSMQSGNREYGFLMMEHGFGDA
jgi:hypothetical protein